jgi:uncharacterized membrane protein
MNEPKLSRAQRAADVVTEFCGSWTFVASAVILCALWPAVNHFKSVDPYPFIFFNLILTVVSTLQGPLIMMSQNRQMERDRDAVQGLHAKLDELLSRPERQDVATLKAIAGWVREEQRKIGDRP